LFGVAPITYSARLPARGSLLLALILLAANGLVSALLSQETDVGQGARAAVSQPPLWVGPIDGPTPPNVPDVINRDDAGNATVRAVRLDGSLDVDGELNEPVYRDVPAVSGFIQSLPNEGAAASELTEVWIMYDNENVYISARVHEGVPESLWVANEMRRDATGIGNNDNFGVVLDTFYDRRNGYFLYTNPIGGMSESQLTDEGNPNFDWNPVWDVRTGRFEGGWTVEMEIPFKSIRYRPGRAQVWGIQLRRAIRRKNEFAHLTLVSQAAAGTGRNGMTRVSRAATLVGIEAPARGVNVDVKPYGIGSLTTDRRASPAISNKGSAEWGGDVKWSVTQNLTADFTYNTDFAQVEVDEQQINLTRFNLFFPEKREFFLESRGIFRFPASGGRRRGGAGRGSPVPTLFFSRRIGLEDGQPVPILGGARLTGKIGPFDVGAVSLQTDDLPGGDAACLAIGCPRPGVESTNFSVMRLRADVLRRSNIGALVTRRSEALASSGSNQTYGADASFSFFDELYLTGYYAGTQTHGMESRDRSYGSRISYDGDERGFRASHVLVEDNFNPEVGFVPRSGFRETQLTLRVSPRPRSIQTIRQVTLEASVDYFENAELRFVETRDITGQLRIDFENSDQFSLAYANSYENLAAPEHITGAIIPAGRYQFSRSDMSYSFGTQRSFSGRLSASHGAFYDGQLTSVGVSRSRIELLRQLSIEPSVSFNAVRLPDQYFDTVLTMMRVNVTFTPRMLLSGLVQFNSSADSFSTNVRFRWEYAPGSEVFLVWTEQRESYEFKRFPALENRGLVIKATRLLRL